MTHRTLWLLAAMIAGFAISGCGEDESLNYVIARTFYLWLDNRGQLFPFYRAFRDGRANDPTGEKAFVAITKQTPAEANDEFLRFARGL